MIKKFSHKILVGFFMLIIFLAAAGFISIYEFIQLSNSVDALIEDNYTTIQASRDMLEALEREDSGILLLILGEWEEGRSILDQADKQFWNAFETAKNNITEPGEADYIKIIEEQYTEYKMIWQRPIVDTDKEGDLRWYHSTMHKKFLQTKSAVNDLMALNQNSMYHEASVLKSKSHRAIMPDIVAIIAAIFFAVLLNFFISKYYLRPLKKITKIIRDYTPKKGTYKTTVDADKEITDLEMEVSRLIERIS